MNNKGLKIVLVVLIIIVLALGGFIVYEKVLNKNNNVIDNNNKANDNIKPDDNKTDCKLDTSLVSKFIGTYTYEGEYVEKEKNASGETKYEEDPWASGKMTSEKLVLNEDGSASASAGNVRAGSYSAEGKWYISNNELIIINDKCKAYEISNDGEIVYGNCNPIWSYPYEITNDTIIISSRNNSMVKVILNKVND
mgnify:CR=1 FL=1